MIKRTIFCKHLKPVADCPVCYPAFLSDTTAGGAYPHQASIERRALEWALGDDIGTSSKTIARHMLGIEPAGLFTGPPSDAADRGRCIRLLQLIPEWVARLDELVKTEKPKESLVFGAGGMRSETNSWAKQIPLILAEAAR